jgi:hypothetical protein
LHVLGRDAKTEACGRSFAVLLTQVSTVGLRLRHIISAWAVATRCRRRRFQESACACGT